MNTANTSEAVPNVSWASTPATAQSWPPATSYDQYYNYYQSVPPPTTNSTPTTNYQQDYSQAWDEYYKAYYGQSYSTPTTQYPSNYSYDQYGYANFSAPPPNYYDPPPQPSTYDYSQPAATVNSSYPSYNTSTVSMPPTTNWSEPPPTFSQPSTYNSAQSYEQPQSFNHPPPISSIYETPYEQNNSLNQIQQSRGDQMKSYSDPLTDKQQKYDNKTFDSNLNNNFKLNQPLTNPISKETSYMEQFPPPSFGSPIKQNNRGRCVNFSNTRGRPQGSRNNFIQGRNLPFNRGAFNNNNDRRQFNSNEYCNEFSNTKQNMPANRRGSRGGYNTNKGFQQRNVDPWYQSDEMGDAANKSAYSYNEYEEDNPDAEDHSYSEWNLDNDPPISDNDQNYSQHNLDVTNQRKDFESSKYAKNFDSNQGFDNQSISQTSQPAFMQRNGSYYQNNKSNFRPNDRFQRPFPRQMSNPQISQKPTVKLMDVVVQLSSQSPVIKRRQNMMDEWQREIKNIHNQRISINYFWPVLKSALSPEMQELLHVNCYSQNECVLSEINFEDVFLIQGRGDHEEMSIESASKMLFEMLKNRVFVLASNREADGELVPGFCISSNPHSHVNLPPICRNSNISNNSQFLSGNAKNVKNPVKASASQLLETGIFLVIEASTNERDQSIASLVATARFNNSTIDYQHEKLPHAPHISLCVITIDGVEIERHEARDYLVAKRQAADKVVSKLKQTRPQIATRFDKAKLINKDELKGERKFEDAMKDYLQNFASSNEDIILKLDCDFSVEEKNILTTIISSLNLSHKSEGKNIFIFKQFSIAEMKKRLLNNGFCAQYQLIEEGSDIIC